MSLKFVGILLVICLLLIVGLFTLIFIPQLQSVYVFSVVNAILVLVLLGLLLWIIQIILTIILLWYNINVPNIMIKLTKEALRITYPAIEFFGVVFSIDKKSIRRSYTNLNNQLVMSEEYGLSGEEILIISPHCLQKSSCPYKITNDIKNCKKCGNCKVNPLIDLHEKYGVNFRVASGGTIARRIIMELRPKAIIAVACERDLVNGLQDVKKIPIIAVTNKRLNGPCIDTEVNTLKVEHAILKLMKE
ncbi:DUF116 domain-containing protein [Serpentinicella sp. ANB-PHB4]|uniref:DUF116 domain-containing protein n=1 Tax=Serpentinicella sp. ANB-PHB4 TaxID=3074076 RepID=UPI00285A0C2D|nr:DUF116 domain-containing protein [Serpentinicella sp. ANB-PHB4]MDR5658322.1 DUF116 domain-containing protein [Serpentinicella sp. ANB-PHB4]